jgi:hypothetical protein
MPHAVTAQTRRASGIGPHHRSAGTSRLQVTVALVLTCHLEPLPVSASWRLEPSLPLGPFPGFLTRAPPQALL